MRSLSPIAVAASLLLVACSESATADEGSATDAPVAAATTTPIGSVLDQVVACAGATSFILMAPGDDPHEFSPSSAQLATLARVPVIFANGLGLEEGLGATLESAESDGARVVELGPEIDPIEFNTLDTGDEHADDHTKDGGLDPHFWLDASRMATAAELMGSSLADATGDAAYAECGAAVHDELMQLHDELTETLAAVAADRRTIVSDHASFGYFAQAYGFDVAGIVIPGGSTQGEPSSEELADLVATIEANGVPAIFSDTAAGDQLVQAVAAEVGGDFTVTPLFVGSVGPADSEAATYQGMMRTDAERIAEALR